MVSRFLITTALEETWPTDDTPILFLGEWCRLYDRKAVWEKRDAIVAPYHWDDRAQLNADYEYLGGLYEELLAGLVIELNDYHRTSHGLRFWRIVVGPWLGYFVQVLFDRWKMLCVAHERFQLSGAKVISNPTYPVRPYGMSEFIQASITDRWNEAIYGELMAYFAIPIERVALTGIDKGGSRPSPSVFSRHNLVQYAKRSLNWLSRLFPASNTYFLLESYLPLSVNLAVQARLGQVPRLWFRDQLPRPGLPLSSADESRRITIDAHDFPSLARHMVTRHLPIAYREEFRTLVASAAGRGWPRTPKAIFTSNAYCDNDEFKVWAAQSTESGVPLVIGQHGGNYGIAKWNFFEQHEIAIADRYLTWGWTAPEQASVVPLGNFKQLPGIARRNPAGYVLVVGMVLPRQSYWLYSIPVAGQWLDYHRQQVRFVQALPRNIRECLLVRLFREDFGWCQRERWNDAAPDVALDKGLRPMADLVANSRIYISTYNATTYLESMHMNFPTVIFWNPVLWEIRSDAIPYFRELQQVGIFHDTPESAAQHLTSIWDDIDAWWSDAKTQSVRAKFCYHYSRAVATDAVMVEVLKDCRGEYAREHPVLDSEVVGNSQKISDRNAEDEKTGTFS